MSPENENIPMSLPPSTKHQNTTAICKSTNRSKYLRIEEKQDLANSCMRRPEKASLRPQNMKARVTNYMWGDGDESELFKRRVNDTIEEMKNQENKRLETGDITARDMIIESEETKKPFNF